LRVSQSELRYKARALRHLDAIHRYIADYNPAAAKDVVERIEHSIGRLLLFPMSGRPGVVQRTRLLSIPGLPYIVVHRVRADTIEILAVLRTAQQRRRRTKKHH
jgi:plasmid stabilization system protein ParE